MPPAARVTDMHTCPMFTGPVPHVGGPILPPGAPTVLIGFLPAATVTNMATCVGPPDVIVKGSSGVFINFLPAARIGDQTAHGGVIILGCPTVLIGEIGSPSPGAGGMGGIMRGLAAASVSNPIAPVASAYNTPGAGGPGGATGGAQLVNAAYTPPARRAAEDQIICKAVCYCNQNPDVSSSGAKLKQQCVSSTLKAADTAMGGKSPLKPEVSYNVVTTPPTLLPASPVPDDPDIPGNVAPGYERRRPDIVIVNDVNKPPTADNISRIVEIKFPGDRYRPGQLPGYEKIAGGPSNVSTMSPQSCGCGEEEKERSPVRIPDPGKLTLLAELLALLLMLARLLAPVLILA